MTTFSYIFTAVLAVIISPPFLFCLLFKIPPINANEKREFHNIGEIFLPCQHYVGQLRLFKLGKPNLSTALPCLYLMHFQTVFWSFYAGEFIPTSSSSKSFLVDFYVLKQGQINNAHRFLSN